jgi:O-antigen ligase
VKGGVGARRAPSRGSASNIPRVELLLAGFGLFLCTGLFEVFPWAHFRLVKHAFYALVILLVLLRWRSTAAVARHDPLMWLLVGLVCLSALWSDFPAWTLKRGLVILQTTIFGLYLATRFPIEAQARILAWVMLAGLVVCVGVAGFDPAAFMSYGDESAFRGSLTHKNVLGKQLALASLAFLLQWNRASPPRWLLSLGIAVAVPLLIQSRSLAGALVAATIFAIVLIEPVAARLQLPALRLIPTVLVVLGVAAAIAGFLDEGLAALGKDPTLTGRTKIWEGAIAQIADRPLLGHSIASNWQLQLLEQTGFWFSNAHNGFLQLTLDLGIVGLSIFVVHLGRTLILSVRRVPEAARPAYTWASCVASFVLVYNLVEVTVMMENSIVWVLYASTGFALRGANGDARFRAPARGSRSPARGRRAGPDPTRPWPVVWSMIRSRPFLTVVSGEARDQGLILVAGPGQDRRRAERLCRQDGISRTPSAARILAGY